MFIASKPSILLAIFILFSVSSTESLNIDIDIYQRVLNKLLTKDLKNHFQPSTTTEKPPSTEKMTFDKSPTKTTSILESNSPNLHHSQKDFLKRGTPATFIQSLKKDCLQKCTYTKWIYSLCRCLIHTEGPRLTCILGLGKNCVT